MYLAIPLILGGREAMGDSIPDVFHCTPLSLSPSSIEQVGTLYPGLGHWSSITSNRFVLSMVKGHHVQLRYHPQLTHSFK